MSHLRIFPTVPIRLSEKFAPSEPLRMSPVSDSPSTSSPNDDMFSWLAPPANDFDQSTPPDSPRISIGEDPLLFDLDMDSESDPVTPDALFSITDLMDVDGHGIGLHQHIDLGFELNMSHREPALKESETAGSNSFSQVVLSETHDSLTSANRDSKTPSPRQQVPNTCAMNLAPIPLQSQTIDNFIFEPLSSPNLHVPHPEGTVSENSTSSTGKRSPKRAPVRRVSVKAESPVASIAKTRGSPTNSTDKSPSSAQGDVMKGVKAMHLSQRKRSRTAPAEEDGAGKEGGKQRQKNGSEGGQTRTAKVGMRFRRRGAERRTGKTSEEEKNVPVLDKCVKCSTMAKDTPMMRKGPDGCRSLCNACGLKWSRHGVF